MNSEVSSIVLGMWTYLLPVVAYRILPGSCLTCTRVFVHSSRWPSFLIFTSANLCTRGWQLWLAAGQFYSKPLAGRPLCDRNVVVNVLDSEMNDWMTGAQTLTHGSALPRQGVCSPDLDRCSSEWKYVCESQMHLGINNMLYTFLGRVGYSSFDWMLPMGPTVL